ncbi:MAG: cupin domain-containing protein [Gemmatimonadota bacterium]
MGTTGRRASLAASLALLTALGSGGAAEARAQETGAPGDGYEAATRGTRWLEGEGGFSIKLLLEPSNLGGTEMEMGEITFPPGSGMRGGDHRHGSVEIFYILEGELDHIVNGVSHRLTPGMVGVVRPGDVVVHRVEGPRAVRALVIWAPGGEAARIARFFESRPVE